MISKKLAIEVLNIATATSGDFAEIYLEENKSSSLFMDNCKIESSTDTITYGAGIRILKGLQSVYGYTNDISRKGLTTLAHDLASSFQGERQIEVNSIENVKEGKRNKIKIPYESYPKDKLIALLTDASQASLSYDEKIIRTTLRFAHNHKDVEIFNTKGKCFHDSHTRGRVYITSFASKDGIIESAGVGPGAQKGMEYFLDEIDLIQEAKNTAQSALTMLDAKECPSGKMPVVIGNGFGGVIFHESCGHSLEASAVSKNLSVFANKLGTQIASSVVSAVDDGTIDGGWGSGNIDDEGNPTQRNVLIKDGILTSYLIDDFNGRRMSMEGNGASRRESYRYEPTSRMSNTFILPGNSTFEEMISSIEFGLYAKNMGGGSVNPATGEFNFAVNEGYIIEHGKISYPVKGATLIGSGKEVLMNIDMVGKDLLRAQGMCGAASGSIPADVGQPTIRVKEITVGGRGGAR
jgi:TldD protein